MSVCHALSSHIRRRFICWSILLLAALPLTSHAVAVVSIGNGLADPNGSYQNATNIAQLLVFTNGTINADNEIVYVETVNLATSPAGVAVFSLANNAPKTTINGDVTMGVGIFNVNSSQIDLAGSIIRASDGMSPAANRLVGNASTVNVLSNSASLQQALYLTQNSVGLSTINASSGTANGLAFDYDSQMLVSGGSLSGAVTMNNVNALLELNGYGFELDTGGGFVSIGPGAISATSGQLKGFLASGDAFDVTFTQSVGAQISIVPVPAAVWLFGSGLGLLGGMLRRQTA